MVSIVASLPVVRLCATSCLTMLAYLTWNFNCYSIVYYSLIYQGLLTVPRNTSTILVLQLVLE